MKFDDVRFQLCIETPRGTICLPAIAREKSDDKLALVFSPAWIENDTTAFSCRLEARVGGPTLFKAKVVIQKPLMTDEYYLAALPGQRLWAAALTPVQLNSILGALSEQVGARSRSLRTPLSRR